MTKVGARNSSVELNKAVLSVASTLVALAVSTIAVAGIPECNNLRLAEVGQCEVRVSTGCKLDCEGFGVYKKACATRLQTVCSRSCTLEADPMCTGGCTEVCVQSCDRGENVVCLHNCFGECTGGCDLECEGDVDPARCRASCEANCDAECDTACKPLVDGDCYEHCIECCGGSCTAQANLSCQNVCQEQEFEDCEYELRGSCEGGCDVDGALFCDGQFVLAGKQIPSCVNALLAQGLPEVEGWSKGSVVVTDDGIDADVDALVGGETPARGCSLGVTRSSRTWLWLSLIPLGIFGVRRRHVAPGSIERSFTRSQ